MNKKHLILVLLGIICIFTASTEQLTKVGIVDFSKIAAVYLKDSSAMREIEKMISNTNTHIEEKQNELDDLRIQRLHAQDQEDKTLAEKLGENIKNLESYIKEYHSIMQNKIKKLQENLIQSSEFVAEIYKEIAYIGETEGFSMVLNASNNPYIVWYNNEVDITDMVIERLKLKAGY